MDLALASLAALALGAATPPAGPIVEPPRLSVAVAAAALDDARLPTSAPFAFPAPGRGPGSPADTLVEYSSAYYTRLTIHRWGSYAMLPLFAAQYYVGSQLYSGRGGDWAEDLHPTLALGVAGLFGVNTVTGLWNLWDGRKDPNERGRRFTHATLMLLADAGFVATGILADEAEDDGRGGGASTHRAVAIGSMAVSTVGWLIMTDLFRRD